MDEQVDDNLEKKKARDLILSAPLFYSNDVPHIGHFLTMTAVDLMRKILILFSQTLRKSRHICFLAGVDEHGKKIENTALKKGKKPHEFVEGMNNEFISIWKAADMDFQNWIRTSSFYHQKFVHSQLLKLYSYKQLYVGNYSGLYCVSCEEYRSFRERGVGKCKKCFDSLVALDQKALFLRISAEEIRWLKKKYSLKKIRVFPLFYIREIGNLEEKNYDLCISRSGVEWGIRIPEKIEKDLKLSRSVVYVWFEALLGYISSACKYWQIENWKEQTTIQFLGRDISKFHLVYWPIMLKKLGFRLPDIFVVHSMINDAQGRKMSKSKKNAAGLTRLLDLFGSPPLRLWVLANFSLEKNISFSEENIISFWNDLMVNGIGNLISRVGNLLRFSKMQGSCQVQKKNVSSVGNLIEKKILNIEKEKEKAIYHSLNSFRFSSIFLIFKDWINELNHLLELRKPWEVNELKKEDEIFLQVLFCSALRILFWLSPVLGKAETSRIVKLLGMKKVGDFFSTVGMDFTKVRLFKRFDSKS